MRRALLLGVCSALAACATVRPLPPSVKWEQRVTDLQQGGGWQLDGRAAVAIGTLLGLPANRMQTLRRAALMSS